MQTIVLTITSTGHQGQCMGLSHLCGKIQIPSPARVKSTLISRNLDYFVHFSIMSSSFLAPTGAQEAVSLQSLSRISPLSQLSLSHQTIKPYFVMLWSFYLEDQFLRFELDTKNSDFKGERFICFGISQNVDEYLFLSLIFNTHM